MQSENKASRRGFMLGATVAGAAAAAVATLPKVQTEPAAAVSEPQPAPEKGGGYRVSEHVKRYYKTTTV
jgi:cobalamin biosynthesis protein CbiD